MMQLNLTLPNPRCVYTSFTAVSSEHVTRYGFTMSYFISTICPTVYLNRFKNCAIASASWVNAGSVGVSLPSSKMKVELAGGELRCTSQVYSGITCLVSMALTTLQNKICFMLFPSLNDNTVSISPLFTLMCSNNSIQSNESKMLCRDSISFEGSLTYVFNFSIQSLVNTKFFIRSDNNSKQSFGEQS